MLTVLTLECRCFECIITGTASPSHLQKRTAFYTVFCTANVQPLYQPTLSLSKIKYSFKKTNTNKYGDNVYAEINWRNKMDNMTYQRATKYF
jgi:hypothetical protein